MPRVAKGNKRWKLKGTLYGYVKSINGNAVMFARGRSKALGMPFVAANKEKALAALAEWIGQPNSRKATEGGITLGAAIDGWTAYKGEQLLGTYARRNILRWVAQYWQHVPDWAKITPDLITGVVQYHKDAGRWSAATQKQYVSFLSSFCNWLVAKDYLTNNPTKTAAAKLMLAKVPRPIPTEFTANEISRIVRHLLKNDHRYYGLAVLWLYHSSMRPVEIMRMRWEDVTETAITIYGKGQAGDGERIRYLPLASFPLLVRILAELRQAGGEEYVWLKKISQDLLSRRFRRAAIDAGVWLSRYDERLGREIRRTLYKLRGSGETRMESMGISDLTIEDLTGHKRPVRLKHYRQQRTVEQLAARINRETGHNQNSTKMEPPKITKDETTSRTNSTKKP